MIQNNYRDGDDGGMRCDGCKRCQERSLSGCVQRRGRLVQQQRARQPRVQRRAGRRHAPRAPAAPARAAGPTAHAAFCKQVYITWKKINVLNMSEY